MSPDNYIYAIIGLYCCNSIISISFDLGHEKLDVYKAHALSILFTLFLLITTSSRTHQDYYLTLVSIIGMFSIMILVEKTFYSHISGGTKTLKKTRFVFTLGFLICVACLAINKQFFYNILSLVYGPFYILIIIRELRINNTIRADIKEVKMIFFSSLSEVLLIFIFIISNFINPSFKIALALLFISFLNLVFSNFLLVPIVLRHVKNENKKRVQRASLKEKNLNELIQNTRLESKVASAMFYSELASLDINFLKKVSEKIEFNLKTDKDKSSLILTKLSKHLRNQVYFENKLKGALDEELRGLNDFITLCNIIKESKCLILKTNFHEISIEGIHIRTHIILPLVKSIFKEVFDSKDNALINVELVLKNELSLHISLKGQDISLDKSKLGLEYIQSRLLDSKPDYGKIDSISDTSVSATLFTYLTLES